MNIKALLVLLHFCQTYMEGRTAIFRSLQVITCLAVYTIPYQSWWRENNHDGTVTGTQLGKAPMLTLHHVSSIKWCTVL